MVIMGLTLISLEKSENNASNFQTKKPAAQRLEGNWNSLSYADYTHALPLSANEGSYILCSCLPAAFSSLENGQRYRQQAADIPQGWKPGVDSRSCWGYVCGVCLSFAVVMSMEKTQLLNVVWCYIVCHCREHTGSQVDFGDTPLAIMVAFPKDV